MIKKIILLLVVHLNLYFSNAQNYEATLISKSRESGFIENVILIKSNDLPVDSITVISGIERDFSYSMVSDKLFYTYKSNSDVQTNQTTFYIMEYKICDDKLMVISKKWIKKSLNEAKEYKIYFIDDVFHFDYSSIENTVFLSKKVSELKTKDLIEIDEKISRIIK